ncbi:MAG: DUF6378 domain-containing protein [Oscillospiraceae bacterium]|nr:DUF6378 domain-containing protein [Oscillospiraceae bacterium]
MNPEQPQAPGFKAKEFAETYGPEVVQGYLDGLNAGNSVAEKVVESIYKEMGIKSPSEVVPKLHSEEPTVSNLETDEKEVWIPVEQKMEVDLSGIPLEQLMAVGAQTVACSNYSCKQCPLSRCRDERGCISYAIVHPEDTLRLLGVDIDSYPTQAEQDVLKAENAELLEKQQQLMRDIAAMEKERDTTLYFETKKPDAPQVKNTMMTRAECLDRAKACVCGKRKQDYGSPENNFAAIATYWEDYLTMSHCVTLEPETDSRRVALYPADVANMMCLFKLARLTSGTATADSYVDLAGYAACGCEIATKGDAACSS